ncbi:MAG: hypothetical protein AAGE03_16805, partial [Pseudomonadota bacterium]
MEIMENSGNVVSATAGDTEYEANRDLAQEIEDSAEFTLGLFQPGEATYQAGSDVYEHIANFIDKIDDATIDFHGNNSSQLNSETNTLLNNIEGGLHQIQGDALDGGGSVDEAARYLSAADWLFGEMTGSNDVAGSEEEGGDGTSGTTSGEGLDLSGVSETLSDAKSATTTGEKASLLQEAIAALIDALEGGGSDSGGSGSSPVSDNVGESIGEAIDALTRGGE